MYFNRAAEQLYGFTRSEAIGRVTHELLQTESPSGIRELEAKLLRHGVRVGELTHRRSDGARVIVDARLALLSGVLEPRLVLEVNRDCSPTTEHGDRHATRLLDRHPKGSGPMGCAGGAPI